MANQTLVDSLKNMLTLPGFSLTPEQELMLSTTVSLLGAPETQKWEEIVESLKQKLESELSEEQVRIRQEIEEEKIRRKKQQEIDELNNALADQIAQQQILAEDEANREATLTAFIESFTATLNGAKETQDTIASLQQQVTAFHNNYQDAKQQAAKDVQVISLSTTELHSASKKEVQAIKKAQDQVEHYNDLIQQGHMLDTQQQQEYDQYKKQLEDHTKPTLSGEEALVALIGGNDTSRDLLAQALIKQLPDMPDNPKLARGWDTNLKIDDDGNILLQNALLADGHPCPDIKLSQDQLTKLLKQAVEANTVETNINRLDLLSTKGLKAKIDWVENQQNLANTLTTQIDKLKETEANALHIDAPAGQERELSSMQGEALELIEQFKQQLSGVTQQLEDHSRTTTFLALKQEILSNPKARLRPVNRDSEKSTIPSNHWQEKIAREQQPSSKGQIL